MRAAWYERTGPARETLIVGELPDPQPGPGEVRVRVAASGVNPSDVKARGGSRPMLGPQIVPHSDGAGVIDAVGAGVASARIGERVWLWNGQWKRTHGTCAELIALPSAQAVVMPAGLSFEAGACLGIPALTAYRALTIDGAVAGECVLVTGGAGGVGHYAIQLARLLGAAKILATVSGPEKAAHARAAGADEILDYRHPSWVEQVRALTGGRGVDRMVDLDIAGHGKLLPQLVRQHGLVVAYGTNTPSVTFDFTPMIVAGLAVRFFIVYELAEGPRGEGLEAINRYAAEGRLQHAVGGRYPLERVVEAHEAVEQKRHIGNTIVTF